MTTPAKNIPQETIDAANSDIVGVIGRYIKLTKDGAEYSACCPFHHEKTPSFKVNPRKGLYHCFGCGANGNAIGFVMQHTGAPFPEAVSIINGGIANNPVDTRRDTDATPTWQSLPVVADGAPDAPFRHYKHGNPSATWAYRTASGELIGYVCRFEVTNADGSKGKETIPLSWARNTTTNEERWRWLSFSAPRPLFGLEHLSARPAAKVLIVEGEKTAEAARRLFPTFAVVSWPGGGNAVSKADWRPLAGRKVIYWPDWDWKPFKDPHPKAGEIMPTWQQPGVIAMRDIHKLISGIVELASVIPPAECCPSGWDLADDPWREDFDPIEYAKANIADASDWFGQIIRQATEETIAPKKPRIIQHEQPSTDVDLPQPTDPGTVDIFSPLFDTNTKGKPLATIENMREILRRIGTTVRYNVISKQVEILIPGASFSVDNNANASMAHIISWTNRFQMATGSVGEYVLALADQNPYNPVANWITSREWDGVPRFRELCETIREAAPRTLPDGRNMRDVVLMRWMISAVAAAFEPNGIVARGVLVLQGPQNIGKTHWLKKLAPKHLDIIKDGITLNPSDKDSVMLCVSNWIVELGELDATFRKADIASLKSFLTLDRDKLRRPYDRTTSEFARRTVFFASVNPRQFLHDATGNSRFWTVECTSIDHNHDLDMQQVWAEIYHLYRQGIGWYLDADEFAALNDHNEDYTSSDPVHDLIDSGFDWQSDPVNWVWRMNATSICLAAGIQKPTKADTNTASTYVVSKYKVKTIKVHGVKQWMMPPKLFKYDNTPPDPAHPGHYDY